MAAEDIAYKYTGKDPLEAHHSGIPARDLTEAEVKGLDTEHRETLKHSPIYRASGTKAKDAPKVETPSQEPTQAAGPQPVPGDSVPAHAAKKGDE
jgi:hypothetical protein